jgi:hypothetical protein
LTKAKEVVVVVMLLPTLQSVSWPLMGRMA